MFTNFDAKYDKQGEFFIRQHKELVKPTSMSLRLSEDTKVLKEESINFPSKLDEHKKKVCVEDMGNNVDVDDRHTDGHADSRTWSDTVSRGTIRKRNVQT